MKIVLIALMFLSQMTVLGNVRTISEDDDIWHIPINSLSLTSLRDFNFKARDLSTKISDHCSLVLSRFEIDRIQYSLSKGKILEVSKVSRRIDTHNHYWGHLARNYELKVSNYEQIMHIHCRVFKEQFSLKEFMEELEASFEISINNSITELH